VKRLAQSSVGTGSGTLLYTVPSGYKTDVESIDVANTTAAALSFTLHLVASGGSPSTSNMLFPSVSIPGNTMVQWVGSQHMTSGEFIQGIGSGSGLTVHITGDELRSTT
jgi:hypothetical protein